MEADWVSEAPPVRFDLLQSPAGGITWAVHQPLAQARIRLHGAGADGALEAEPEIGEQGVRLPGAGGDLTLSASRPLREGAAAGAAREMKEAPWARAPRLLCG
ncbi:MAG TPA: hypothetical protein VD969_24660 [Symbiobacteriaceae bacterium]|nr:hypothetical protein [Symbiobacteriaceae bacterium]